MKLLRFSLLRRQVEKVTGVGRVCRFWGFLIMQEL